MFEPTTRSDLYVVPGRPFPQTPGDRDDYRVVFHPDDPERPINYAMHRRVRAKAVASIIVTFVSWGSSVIGPCMGQIEKTFHVGTTVAILTVTLYIVGFAVGPIIWGPASEMYGRKLPILIGTFGFTLFGFACATAKDFQTLAICRFFMGAMGCTVLVVGPAISADVFTVTQRGKAVSGVIFCLVAGPMIAPIVGSFITNSYLGWRWTMYITAIMGALGCFMILLGQEETYPQIALLNRARRIREETGNWAIGAPLDDMELNAKEVLNRTLFKPFRILMTEPMLLFLSLYHGFIYGILYLCLEAVPYIFQHHYHYRPNISYLPYLGMFTGSVIVVMVNLIFFDPMTEFLIKKSGMEHYPESRLPLMMMCSVVFPMGLFMLCWTGAYHVHWIVPTIGLGLVGFGLIGIFQALLIYIIDCYLPIAATAIAANTFVRSAMGGAFPLFALQMFRNLGTQWAGTLLGCLATVAVPAPFFFFIYGPRIRAKSTYGESGDEKGELEEESKFGTDRLETTSLISEFSENQAPKPHEEIN